MTECKRKRLAFYLPSLQGGGAERVLFTLANGFADRGHNVDLVLAKAEGPYLGQVHKNIHVVDLAQNHVLRSLPRLIAYLKRVRPTAILSGLEHANLITIWAKLFAHVDTRVVVSIHNTMSQVVGGNVIKRRFVNTLTKYYLHYADGIVAVSQGVADDYAELMQLPRTAIRVIYNPVATLDILQQAKEEPQHPWYIEKTSPVILSVGRLTIAKNYSILIHAMKMVHAQTGARLIVLGEGEEREKLAAEIKREGLERIINMPGFVNNPFSYMKRSDVFVLCSVWEGFSMVLVEAMTLGTPIVSTDCLSGPAEILEGGKWGRLVPVGDVKALALAIIETLRKPQGNMAVKRANDFSVDKIIHEYAGILSISI